MAVYMDHTSTSSSHWFCSGCGQLLGQIHYFDEVPVNVCCMTDFAASRRRSERIEFILVVAFLGCEA